ncbi:DUF177 domain-containing protein [Myxococcota bacterium]|nr:DUF177 domain-containing protein [Myxococcota bacterium]
MKLKVSELSTLEEAFQSVFAVDWIQSILEQDAEKDSLHASLYNATDPFSLNVRVYCNDDDEVFFYGNAVGTIGFTCVRSLEEGKMPVTLDISGMFRPRKASKYTESPSEDDEDDPSFYFYEGDEIDFGDVLREQLFLFLPINPTLSEELPIPLSELQKASEPSPSEPTIDPRWSALLNIQKGLGQTPSPTHQSNPTKPKKTGSKKPS